MQKLLDPLRKKFPLDEHKWQEYISRFKRLEIPAKTLLLKEGEISKKLFLVEQGCIRAWFNNSGKDVTFQFFFENSTVASMESFRKNIPSAVSIETIEPSILWCITKADLNRIIEEIKDLPPLRDAFIDAVFERTFDYMKHFLSFIRDTPEQRYLDLIKKKPEIVKRVPQHYIASYLGITTVHLSRIKSKLAKGKNRF